MQDLSCCDAVTSCSESLSSIVCKARLAKKCIQNSETFRPALGWKLVHAHQVNPLHVAELARLLEAIVGSPMALLDGLPANAAHCPVRWRLRIAFHTDRDLAIRQQGWDNPVRFRVILFFKKIIITCYCFFKK